MPNFIAKSHEAAYLLEDNVKDWSQHLQVQKQLHAHGIEKSNVDMQIQKQFQLDLHDRALKSC